MCADPLYFFAFFVLAAGDLNFPEGVIPRDK